MIKYNSGDKETSSMLEIKGTLIELAAEASTFLHSMYMSFLQDSPIVAEKFKELITETVSRGYIFMDDKQLHEVANSKKEESAKVIDALNGLLDLLKKAAGNEPESKDIRSADFDSDDDFRKWFHTDEEEE